MMVVVISVHMGRDDYEYIKLLLHKVRIRERGYTEEEATKRIIEYFRQSSAITNEIETDNKGTEEKQDNGKGH